MTARCARTPPPMVWSVKCEREQPAACSLQLAAWSSPQPAGCCSRSLQQQPAVAAVAPAASSLQAAQQAAACSCSRMYCSVQAAGCSITGQCILQQQCNTYSIIHVICMIRIIHACNMHDNTYNMYITYSMHDKTYNTCNTYNT